MKNRTTKPTFELCTLVAEYYVLIVAENSALLTAKNSALYVTDYNRLTTNHIKIGIDGRKWLTLDRNKTDEPESVRILPIAAQKIEKYNSHPCRIVGEKLIPVYSNQYFNRLLKKICRILNIDIQLTTHYGRHIFATMIALDSGADLKTVAQMLGQASVRSAEIYAKAIRFLIQPAFCQWCYPYRKK